MSKKILTIFLSLFLVGILSVSCSNKDTTGVGNGNSTGAGNGNSTEDSSNGDGNSTGAGNGNSTEDSSNGNGNSAVDSSKGIEQFNGNSYVSAQSYTVEQLGGTGYLWISVKDGQLGISASRDNANEPTYEGYFPVTGYGTDYSFSTDYYGQQNAIKGTLKFSSDGSSVTIMFTSNPAFPDNLLNINILCNDTAGAGDGNSAVDSSKGIEQFNGNNYVSKNMEGYYLWISIENGLAAMTPNTDANTPPNFYGYMSGMSGSGTDYNFWSEDRSTEGTLKFASDGSYVTVTLTKNDPAPEAVGQAFVCYKK